MLKILLHKQRYQGIWFITKCIIASLLKVLSDGHVVTTFSGSNSRFEHVFSSDLDLFGQFVVCLIFTEPFNNGACVNCWIVS